MYYHANITYSTLEGDNMGAMDVIEFVHFDAIIPVGFVPLLEKTFGK